MSGSPASGDITRGLATISLFQNSYSGNVSEASLGRKTRDRRFDRTKEKDRTLVGSGAATCPGTVSGAVSGASENRRLLSTDHGTLVSELRRVNKITHSKALEQNLTYGNTSTSEPNKQIQKTFPKYYFSVQREDRPWVLPA